MEDANLVIKLIKEPHLIDWLGLLVAPLITALSGFFILRITKNIEQSQWRNQKVIEKRIQIWEDVEQDLNTIYCYSRCVGKWKGITPPEIIDLKRKVDRCNYTVKLS